MAESVAYKSDDGTMDYVCLLWPKHTPVATACRARQAAAEGATATISRETLDGQVHRLIARLDRSRVRPDLEDAGAGVALGGLDGQADSAGGQWLERVDAFALVVALDGGHGAGG